MAMSQREKFLAIAVGGVVGLLGVQYIYSSIQAGIIAKENQLKGIESKIDEHNRKLTDAKLATKRLLDLQSRSLPGSPENAKQQYSAWLMHLAKECGMENAKLSDLDTGGLRSPAYNAYTLSLSGDIRLDNLVKLLHGYYNRDYMQRIRGLQINQVRDNPEMAKIKLDTQAIALVKAGADKEASLAASGRVTKSADEYVNEILGRNPFGPPNQAPKFGLAGSVDVPRGLEYVLDLKAADPDKRHTVKYKLLTDKPEGLRFDGDGGKISWTPKSNGNYDIEIEAIDTGLPPKSTTHKMTLKVIDPPAAPVAKVEPQFDVASQSYVSAVLGGRERNELWIRSKTDNQKWIVGAGDEITVGSVKGKVVEVNVDEQFAELETDGRRWILSMDDASLQAAYKKAIAD